MVPWFKIRTHSSHRATVIVSGVTGATPMAVFMSIAATDLSKSGATVPSESAAMERIPSHKSNAANNKRQYESSRPLAHSKVMRVEAVNPGRDISNCPDSSCNVFDMNITNMAGSTIGVRLPVCQAKATSSEECLFGAHPQ